MKLIATNDAATRATGQNTLQLANDVDPSTLALDGLDRIDLQFPKFTDGRAYSQAFLLRRRLGFDSAVLRADQDASTAEAQFARFSAFYQGDARTPAPLFSR